MKWHLPLLLVGSLVVLSCEDNGTAHPARPTIDALFPAQPTNYVTDLTHVLTQTDELALNREAKNIQAAQVQLAIVVLPTLRGYAPADVATEIGRRWGVGSKGAVGSVERNNGLVLLIVPKTPANENKGECFLAIGNGVEGRIPDLRAHSTCTEVIIPQFKRVNLSEYASGIMAGVAQIAELASHTRNVP